MGIRTVHLWLTGPLFFIILAGILATYSCSHSDNSDADQGYTFMDVTASAGVANDDHNHFGSVWIDYDRDGWLDLYVANDDENTMYHNKGDGTFTDRTEETGTGDPWIAMSNVFADYDNDGDLDLYSHNFEQSTLYQNNGNVFTDVNVSSGAEIKMFRGTGAAWADYDKDGCLDLHATGFPGGWNVLLHNNCDGTFTDLQESAGLSFSADAMGNSWGDFDRDGFLDLAVAAVTQHDSVFLYRNNGDGTLSDVTGIAGIGYESGSSNSSVAWGDYNNDAWIDLIITEVGLGSKKGDVHNRMYLFENKQDGTFEEVSAAAGLTFPPESTGFWDAAWGDYDNDGDLDLYVAAVGPNLFYRNNGDETFTSILPSLSTDLVNKANGVIWGDYDNDGDLDLYVSQRVENESLPLLSNFLFMNKGGQNNWLKVKLIAADHNFDAIGAKIILDTDEKLQIREVRAGTGFFSQHPLVQHFGVGSATRVDRIEIHWPSGTVQMLTDVSVNQVLTVMEQAF